MRHYYKSILKGIISRTPFRRYIFPRWRYNFTARDLAFMCTCIEEIKFVDGVLIEIGCEYGETTIFLNNVLEELGSLKLYVCIDTFDGFTDVDISFEVSQRGKTFEQLTGFRNNSVHWFRRTLFDAGYKSVQVFKADAASFDYSQFKSLSFVLIDIDLFRPVSICLRKVYDILSPGGIILVDDCDPTDSNYDGAYYAYMSFVRERKLPVDIYGKKLGVIRKMAVER